MFQKAQEFKLERVPHAPNALLNFPQWGMLCACLLPRMHTNNPVSLSEAECSSRVAVSVVVERD